MCFKINRSVIIFRPPWHLALFLQVFQELRRCLHVFINQRTDAFLFEIDCPFWKIKGDEMPRQKSQSKHVQILTSDNEVRVSFAIPNAFRQPRGRRLLAIDRVAFQSQRSFLDLPPEKFGIQCAVFIVTGINRQVGDFSADKAAVMNERTAPAKRKRSQGPP